MKNETNGASPVDFEKFIGQPVRKQLKVGKNSLLTPKPFKSKKYINTIKGVIEHPILKIPAFTFNEDDSFVECRRCDVLDKKTSQEFQNLKVGDRIKFMNNDTLIHQGMVFEIDFDYKVYKNPLMQEPRNLAEILMLLDDGKGMLVISLKNIKYVNLKIVKI